VADRIDPAGRVYAAALHAAAAQAGRVREVDRDLHALVAALHETPPLLRALLNPAVTRDAKHRILARLMEGGDELARNGVLVLAGNGRLGLVADMAAAYAELAAADERILTVEITTAVELAEGQLEALRGRVTAAAGGEANVVANVDPSIIGGLVIGARGVRVDASVRRRLEELRRALIRTPLPVGSEA
jgi:F-type H+-transporting ATPase subunit delta